VLIAAPALIVENRRLRFSNSAYTAIFVFLVLREVGAHYTYSEVPYERWLRGLTGTTMTELAGWQRDHFDRLVHFIYRFAITVPAFEVISARTSP
jgi:putative membrane protein